MVKFLDGATEAHWAAWSETLNLSWYGFLEEHGLKKSSNVLISTIQDCFKSITVHPVSKMKL